MVVRFITILMLFNIALSIGFDPLYLNDKNRPPIERVGDLFQIAIPLSGLGYTYYSNDIIGRKQFWKTYLSSLSLTYILKYTIKKERPNGHCCESFPSGHTSAAFAGAMFINNRYGLKFGIPAIFLASFVGYSRVYAEKHYWEDVLAGSLISVIASLFYTTNRNLDNENLSLFLNPLNNKVIFRIKI